MLFNSSLYQLFLGIFQVNMAYIYRVLFENKFKGSVPMPKRCAPAWSVVIASDSVEVGGSKVEVSICRPALATKDGLSELSCTYLSAVPRCQRIKLNQIALPNVEFCVYGNHLTFS